VRCARPRDKATVISNPAAARPAGAFRVAYCRAASLNAHPRLHTGTNTEPRTEQLSICVQATHGQHTVPGPFQCRRRFPGCGRRQSLGEQQGVLFEGEFQWFSEGGVQSIRSPCCQSRRGSRQAGKWYCWTQAGQVVVIVRL
jgi:hypothetical protein